MPAIGWVPAEIVEVGVSVPGLLGTSPLEGKSYMYDQDRREFEVNGRRHECLMVNRIPIACMD